MSVNRLSYAQKKKLEQFMRGCMEPLPEDHDPSSGCYYLPDYTDRRTAREASAVLDFEVTVSSVTSLRQTVLGHVLSPIKSARSGGGGWSKRLAAVEAAAEDWLAFETKLRALLIEHGFVTEEW